MDDATETRLDKLYRIIEECRYGVHDLSRTELDPVHELPRFNMPLELGIFLAAKRFGPKVQHAKRCLILDVEQYRFQRFISDLAGMDVQPHGGVVDRAVEQTRNWLATVSRRQLPSPADIVRLQREFARDMPDMADRLGLDRVAPNYADFERLVLGWLAR